MRNKPSASRSQFIGLRGFLLDPVSPTKTRGIRDGALLIANGILHDVGEFERLRALPEAKDVTWQFGAGCAVVPGLIDLHSHIPQFPAVGKLEDGLLPWLDRHIFPLEKDFTPAVAKKIAPLFFRELARCGVTQSVLFSSIREDSCHACFEAARDAGTRAIIGKVMMDRMTYGSLPPDKILKTSLDESRRLIEQWHGTEQGRLEYAVSPRFAVSCSREMLAAAASLASETGTFVQTHLSENLEEIRRVRALFPETSSYTAVYASAGITGPRSIFAHCLHLSPDELRLLAETGSRVAHCPSANLFLRSGLFPMEEFEAAGIPFGLGSDVAAGPQLDPWATMRTSLEIQVARAIAFPEKELLPPSPESLFYRSTLGGAEVLGKQAEMGSLVPGKSADLAIIDAGALVPGGRRPNFDAELSARDLLSLLLHRGGPHATIATYVAGRPIFNAPQGALF